MDCRVISPGSFPIDYSFIVYSPFTREAQVSRIDS